MKIESNLVAKFYVVWLDLSWHPSQSEGELLAKLFCDLFGEMCSGFEINSDSIYFSPTQ